MSDSAGREGTDGKTQRPGFERWWQLILGVICMSMVANLQYGWTLFVNPMDAKHHWGLKAISFAFSIFVIVETWLVPAEGYLVDRFGPKLIGVGSGILVAAAWVINSRAETLSMLYTGAVIGGIGVGGVYGACVGNALKWFPDRRGFASGITAMGFGAGSALTVVPIDRMIKAQGYEAAFFKFGIAQGLVVFVLGWLLAAPPANFKVPGKGAATTAPTRDREPLQVLASPAFWIMYLMFMMTATFGLVITAQFTTMSKAFGLGDAQANVLGFTVKAVTFALAMNRVLNGVSRPFFGWVSDRLGRERTMAVAFLCEGVVIYLFGRLGADPGSLILLSGLVFFCYGEIYSLFPAACGDSYGKKFAAANAGLLYTAKGVASLFVPFSVDMASAHGWNSVYLLGASLNVVAAVMAIVLLKPARARLALAG